MIGTSYRVFTDVWARQRDFMEVSAFISTHNEARGGNQPGLGLRLLLARRAERRQAETSELGQPEKCRFQARRAPRATQNFFFQWKSAALWSLPGWIRKT